jgi:TolB-like protein
MNDATHGLLAAGMRMPLAGFVLDLGGDALLDADGRRVNLRPQAWAVLRLLALNAGRLVTKQQFLDAVWPGLVVGDDSLAQAISDARAALGAAGARAIRTVPKRGYLLVVDAAAAPAGADAALAQEADRPSIAVLAFSGMPAGDADADCLARGIARDLIAELARNADLRVIAPYSSFALPRSEAPPAAIGERLRCRFLVDGTVRRRGEALRIDIELIEAASGRVAWASQHEAAAADVPALRDSLMRRIAGTLNSKSRHAERRALARPPRTLDVYTLTVRGIVLTAQYEAAAMREARALFAQAIELDAGYAPAWAWLGFAGALDIWLVITGEWDARRVPECMRALLRAVELDPDLPAAYRGLALAHRIARDFDASLAAARRASELAPSSAECLMSLASAELAFGRTAEALRSIEVALELDPLPHAALACAHAMMLWAHGRRREALQRAGAGLVATPDYVPGNLVRVFALTELGELDAARRAAGELLVGRPALSAEWLLDRYADAALELRSRVAAICAQSGIPRQAADQRLT